MANRIRFDLVGGVGNQLFIYSAGYYLSKTRGARYEPRQPAPAFGDSRHESSINILRINPLVKTSGLITSVGTRLLTRISRLYPFRQKFISRMLNSGTYRSNQIGYDPNLVISNAKKYYGYFQTYKYISEIRNTEPDFLPGEPKNPSEWYLAIRNEILANNSIGMHIRGGDYLNPINKDIGLLSPKYFENALSKLTHSIPNKDFRIYVFTDDLKYADQILSGISKNLNLILVDPPSHVNPTESLLLLSHTKGCVISNSTFAWWAGYLNDSNKLVVAPKKWFKGMNDPEFLMPPHWVLCDSDWVDFHQNETEVRR